MIPLTTELAHRMLEVWARRQRDPRGTKYASTILEAAQGAADFPPELPNFIRVQKAKQDHKATQAQRIADFRVAFRKAQG